MLQGFALLVFAGILLIFSLSLSLSLPLSLSVSSYLSFLLFSLSDCFFIYLSLSLFSLSLWLFLSHCLRFFLFLFVSVSLSLYSAWAFLKKIFFNSSEGRRSNRLLYGNPPTTPVDVVVKGETLLANEEQLLTWLKCFKTISKQERSCSMNFALNERMQHGKKEVSVAPVQCDQIGRFITLWATFQSLWQQLVSQFAHIFRQFL